MSQETTIPSTNNHPRLKIEEIIIGPRHRQDLGDIAALAKSIRDWPGRPAEGHTGQHGRAANAQKREATLRQKRTAPILGAPAERKRPRMVCSSACGE
jgi:hypothetical protein